MDIRRRVDGEAGDNHAEIKMRPVTKARTANGGDPLATMNRPAAFRKVRRDQSKMTVDANKAAVLDQHFQSPHATPVNPDDDAGRDSHDRVANRRGNIDAGMKSSRERPAGKNARTKTRGHAGRPDRWNQLNLRRRIRCRGKR